MNSFLQIPKSILKSYIYNGSSTFISTITLKKKPETFYNITRNAMGTEHKSFLVLSYKSEVEVNVKRMPPTKIV